MLVEICPRTLAVRHGGDWCEGLRNDCRESFFFLVTLSGGTELRGQVRAGWSLERNSPRGGDQKRSFWSCFACLLCSLTLMRDFAVVAP